MSATSKRRWLAPEVIQTSEMDCGPAALKSVFAGFGVDVDYDTLRTMCQTDLDGTSINTLEMLANRFGLRAVQTMVPLDHALLDEARTFPSIVIVQTPTGILHFSVLWRRQGRRVQLMDPGAKRRWPSAAQLQRDLHVHALQFRAARWRQWVEAAHFLPPLQKRIERVSTRSTAETLMSRATHKDADWFALASLDAVTRTVTAFVENGLIRRGKEATNALLTLFETTVNAGPERWNESVPAQYWSARPIPSPPGDPRLVFMGTVLIRFDGPPVSADSPADAGRSAAPPAASPASLPPPPKRPSRLARLFPKTSRWELGAALALAVVCVAAGVAQSVLIGTFVKLAMSASVLEERLQVFAGIVAFLVVQFLFESGLTMLSLAAGRRLESGLRVRFFEKVLALSDQYTRTRLKSDLAQRCHSVSLVRDVPDVLVSIIRAGSRAVLLSIAICWLSRSSVMLSLAAAAVAVGVPLLASRRISEHDMRARAHDGALARFYLDALIGLVPLRLHGAANAIQRQQQSLLRHWREASQELEATSTVASAIQLGVGQALAGVLVLSHLHGGGGAAAALLLVFWSLMLPRAGADLAAGMKRLIHQRNVTLRLLDLLNAEEENVLRDVAPRFDGSSQGMSISFRDVTIRASGNAILQHVTLDVPAGSHVAVVGASGAGKSTLAGVLIGFGEPAEGEIVLDGEPLTPHTLQSVRDATALVDPAVQLWNASLHDNLLYGNASDENSLARIVVEADLLGVVQSLPEGLQTPLGENGTMLSGGEAQRVRYGRGVLRPNVRLVIMDEAFRGVDREKRTRLLAQAREQWRDRTLLYITHDIEEAASFERVLVVGDGRIVEDAPPEALLQDPSSRFAELLRAQQMVRRRVWDGGEWRWLVLENGRTGTIGRADVADAHG